MAGVKQLRLTSIESTRKTYARILRAFNNEEISTEKFKALCYGMAGFLQWWKLEEEMDIESRIVRLEELMNEKL